MDVSEFDFEMPSELIAQRPVEPRDRSRLMVLDRRRGGWSHRAFAELPELLDARDVLARNDTRVVPARLVGQRAKTGGRWEGLFLQAQADGNWEILAKTRGRPTTGERVVVGQGLELELLERAGEGRWIVRPLDDAEVTTGPTSSVPSFSPSARAFALLERHGTTPLPPYIRKGVEGPGDRAAYQTVYALRPGSAAAPTAGLHFTNEVWRRLEARGIGHVDLTLHVGLGTFRPIEAQRLEDHAMHAEWAELSAESAEALRARRRAGGRIVAVGSTSMRTLETAAASGELLPFVGETRLFVRPGHVFQGADAMLTNFHLPRSSLLVMVSAFAGAELVRAAYAEAVRERYRFFSFGDAMLIL